MLWYHHTQTSFARSGVVEYRVPSLSLFFYTLKAVLFYAETNEAAGGSL